MKIRPLNDRVLIRRKAPEVKIGMIHVPDSHAEKRIEAEVVAVGPGARNDMGDRLEMTVKKGDKVLLAKWAGTEVRIEDQEYSVVREDEILGVIE